LTRSCRTGNRGAFRRSKPETTSTG
jgi:hypothetical protein